MKRRDLLAASGLGLAGAAGVWYLFGRRESAAVEHPGTLDADFPTNGDYPPDDDPGDGYPPAFDERPDPPDVDPSTFETTDANGESVPLAPIDVVVRWYRRGEARMVDARGSDQYEQAHVYGAVKSSAQSDSSGGGIEGWPEGDRVVTYCGCPHHLSTQRAAGLLKAGYEEVYALDEGFEPWVERGYPMAGTAFESADSTDGDTATHPSDVETYRIDGAVDPRYAGEYAWARTDGSQEAAPIEADGTFEIRVRFPEVTAETPVEVSTPDFAVTRPLGELASGTVTGD